MTEILEGADGMLLSGTFLHTSTIVLLSKPRSRLWPNAAGSDYSCSFSLLNLSVWSACHLFIHEPLHCMAAVPGYPAPRPVFGISLLNLFLVVSIYHSLLPAPRRLFSFLYCPVQQTTQEPDMKLCFASYPLWVQLYLPYFCFWNAFKSVCYFF